MAILNFERNKPVRFLAISWKEQWKHGHHTLVLAPCVGCNSDGFSCNDMIKFLCENIAINLDEQYGEMTDNISCEIIKKFEKKKWDFSKIREAADSFLRGDLPQLEQEIIEVIEKWIVFYRNNENEDTLFRELSRQEIQALNPQAQK